MTDSVQPYFSTFTSNYHDLSFSCLWYVSAPPGKQIVLTWLDMDVHLARIDVHGNSSHSREDVIMFMQLNLQNGPQNFNLSRHVFTDRGFYMSYKDHFHSGDIPRAGLRFTLSLQGN